MSDNQKGDTVINHDEQTGEACFYCGEPTTARRRVGGSDIPAHPHCPEIKEQHDNKPV
jgi:hypothetical protein